MKMYCKKMYWLSIGKVKSIAIKRLITLKTVLTSEESSAEEETAVNDSPSGSLVYF